MEHSRGAESHARVRGMCPGAHRCMGGCGAKQFRSKLARRLQRNERQRHTKKRQTLRTSDQIKQTSGSTHSKRDISSPRAPLSENIEQHAVHDVLEVLATTIH